MFVGRIEIGDGSGDLAPGLGRDSCGREGGIEAPHQPFTNGLPLGENPDPERGIEIVHAFQQPLVKPLRIEEQRMDARAIRKLQDAFDVDCDLLDVDADREPPRGKAVKPRLLEHGAQFLDDLPQRSAGFFLIRPAPQQSDQAFPALLLGFRQRKVTENRGRLAGSKLDRPALEADREASDQRHGKARRALAAPSPIPSMS